MVTILYIEDNEDNITWFVAPIAAKRLRGPPSARERRRRLVQAKSRAPALISGGPRATGHRRLGSYVAVALGGTGNCGCPLIALSCPPVWPEDREAKHSRRGAMISIAKPVDFPHLINRIEILLRTSRRP